MTESSKISINSLINLFEKKIENESQEGTSKEFVIQHISEQQRQNLVNLLRRKERPDYDRYYVVQQSSRVSLTPSESLALQQQRSQASVDPGSSTVMLTLKSPTRKYLEEPNREKELEEETSNTSQYENENSKISILAKPSDATAERHNSKQERQRQESVKHQQLLEETAKYLQSHQTNSEELRSDQEESAKEKQMRAEMGKRLKQANIRILILSQQLEEKKKKLLRYKTDHKDHINIKEDLKKQTQLNLDLSRQLSHANDKIMALIRRLEAIASNINVENKNSASKLTHLKQKNDGKPRIDQEKDDNKIKSFDNQTKPKIDKEKDDNKTKSFDNQIKSKTDKERDDNKIKLFDNQTKPKINQEKDDNKMKSFDKQIKSKKKQLPLDDVEEEEEMKTSSEETKLEAKIKKSASHSGNDLPVPVFSHSFSMSELTKACHPLPNLRSGFDRPKRKKNYALCTGTQAHKADIERSQLQIISTK